MIPTKKGILLRVNESQKDEIAVGDQTFKMANKFNTNYREKNPVVGIVEQGNDKLKKGQVVICHHNFFYEDSPFWIAEDLYSIPANENIFLRIEPDGTPHGLFGNLIGQRIAEASFLEIPPSYKKNYIDRVVALHTGYGVKRGQIMFTVPYSDYEVVYMANGILHRVIKVFHSDIVAVLKNT